MEPLSPEEIDNLPEAEFDALWIANRAVMCDSNSCAVVNDIEYSVWCGCGRYLLEFDY